MSAYSEKAQTIEALRLTAHELLRHIEHFECAESDAHQAAAEANLYADAVTLRSQTRSLEQMLEGEAQFGTYLGG